jgi:putative intracellular protease/amidase
MNELEGKRVAMLAADGFEQSELLVPKQRLEEAGVKVDKFRSRPERFGAGTKTIGAMRSLSTAPSMRSR